MSWQKDLEDDLDWRFEELAVLKLQAASAQKGSVLQRAILRALVAMLYAHYEGFCKTAIRLYLREIKAIGTRRAECLEPLTVFSLQETFRKMRGFTTDQCWHFYMNSLNQILTSVMDYELDKYGEIALEGESNLYPEMLRANLQHACLPHPEVDTHERLLGSLVGHRNGIAHGKKLTIGELAKYEEFERATSDVMYGLAYSIILAIETQSYLRPVAYEG